MKPKFNNDDKVFCKFNGDEFIGNVDCHLEGTLYVVSTGNVFSYWMKVK